MGENLFRMFSLLHATWKSLTDRPEWKLMLVGVDGVGKTTILEWLKGKFGGGAVPILSPERIQSTVGLNVGKLTILGEAVLVWDLGGKVELRPIWERYLVEADGLIFVVDASDGARLETMQALLRSLLARPELRGKPLLLLGNKYDVRERCVDPLRISAMLPRNLEEERPSLVMPASGLHGFGIQGGMEWMVRRLIAKRKDQSRRASPNASAEIQEKLTSSAYT